MAGKAGIQSGSVRWLYSDLVLDGTLNPLLAAKISFRCLYGDVPKQELDLLKSPPAA